MNFGRILVDLFDGKIAITLRGKRREFRGIEILKATIPFNVNAIPHIGPALKAMNGVFRFGKRDLYVINAFALSSKNTVSYFHFQPRLPPSCVWFSLILLLVCMRDGLRTVTLSSRVQWMMKAQSQTQNDVRSKSLIWIFCNAISKCMVFNKGSQ